MRAPDRHLQGANRLSYTLSQIHREQEDPIYIFVMFVTFLQMKPMERSWYWLSQKAPGLEFIESKRNTRTKYIM